MSRQAPKVLLTRDSFASPKIDATSRGNVATSPIVNVQTFASYCFGCRRARRDNAFQAYCAGVRRNQSTSARLGDRSQRPRYSPRSPTSRSDSPVPKESACRRPASNVRRIRSASYRSSDRERRRKDASRVEVPRARIDGATRSFPLRRRILRNSGIRFRRRRCIRRFRRLPIASLA